MTMKPLEKPQKGSERFSRIEGEENQGTQITFLFCSEEGWEKQKQKQKSLNQQPQPRAEFLNLSVTAFRG